MDNDIPNGAARARSVARRPAEGSAPRGAPAPLADAVLVLDGDGRIASVATVPGWDLAETVRAWAGRMVTDVLDGRGGAIAFEASLEGGTRPVDVVAAHGGGVVPLSAAARVEGGAVRVHLRDRRPEAALHAQLARALSALEADRREDRGLDARHRALLAGSAEAIAVVDAASGRIVELTGAAAALLGGTATGLAGAAFTQCFEGRRRSEFLDALVAAALIGSGEATPAELRHGRGQVRIRPAMVRSGEETVLVCRMGMEGDAPDLRAGGPDAPSEAMLRLLSRTRDGVACLDRDGLVSQANAAFVAMAGLAAPAQVVGRSLARHLLRGEVDLRALTDADRPAAFVTQVVAEDGRRLPVEIAATDLGHGALGLILRDTSLADVTRGGAPKPCSEAAAETASLVGSVPLRDIVAATTEAVERSCIEAALALTGGNRAEAAEMLGLSRQSLYVKLRKFGLPDRGEP